MDNLYRIVLADNHWLFRRVVKYFIDKMPGIKVVGEAGDGVEMLNLVNDMDPDMAILDITMPHLNGLETARAIEDKHPDVKVLMLTHHNDNAYLQRAISAGAKGYVLKQNADRDLFPAISTIRQGRVWYPQSF
ncbi:MAG: response regulator transcription factor [Nitrospirae bacterium]|nr:response regulator transcription factor [Nitrospirota bacterium]